MNVLLTGGAGYIGTHTAVELLAAGHGAVILDDFSNGSGEAVRRVEQIAGKAIAVVRADVCDQATVYGDPRYVLIDEVHPLSAANPYGRTKRMVEHMLSDLQHADSRWCVTVLRYFNPIGAHESGTIDESPLGVPNNLLPYVAQVAAGVRERVQVFGDDYPTPDGTGARDYIHVVDLAHSELGWRAQYDLQHMCIDAWRWQSRNPQGYR